MAEKVWPTLNSRRFGVWHGKNGDTEKLFLLLLLHCFSGGKKSWSPSTAASKPYPFWRKRRRRTYMNLSIRRGNQWMEDFSRTPWCCLCACCSQPRRHSLTNIASLVDWPLGLNIIIYDLLRNRWSFFFITIIRIHLKSLPYWFKKSKFYKKD